MRSDGVAEGEGAGEVSDELWELVEPLMPRGSSGAFGIRVGSGSTIGKALTGILFVLHTGIAWEYLPQELGFGSGMTCWRRLREWQQAGVWERLHELLLAELHAAGRARLVAGGRRLQPRAGEKGGAKTGPEPGRPRPRRAPSTTSSPTAAASRSPGR